MASVFLLLTAQLLSSCDTRSESSGIIQDAHSDSSHVAARKGYWKQTFDQQLELLGHRNWILVVDKAFPLQSAAGMTYINTGDSLLPVLRYVTGQLKKSRHVKPIVFLDRELNYLPEAGIPGLDEFRKASGELLKDFPVKTLLHDSVFGQLDQASRLFSVLVLKTDQVIPYSSVFLQLDCAYWDADREAAMRKRMLEEK
ncbi:hypothetical protein FPE01S_01_10490 [Flavihumibacter petaseus NBRC 106054]|uniref:D-ribose pyranase n=2 Tax=Flavihumibacter TaxID=1004301 RepID=A0A0E9MXA1_9BACT|nr:hypothetical protein FPE01S_01_10490 [Flavihumibacter petaseus NBRC 106054]